MVLPTFVDYAARVASGTWVYEPLVHALRSEGIAVFDADEALLDYFGDEDPRSFFGITHHNARGNVALAEVTRRQLAERGLLTTLAR